MRPPLRLRDAELIQRTDDGYRFQIGERRVDIHEHDLWEPEPSTLLPGERYVIIVDGYWAYQNGFTLEDLE